MVRRERERVSLSERQMSGKIACKNSCFFALTFQCVNVFELERVMHLRVGRLLLYQFIIIANYVYGDTVKYIKVKYRVLSNGVGAGDSETTRSGAYHRRVLGSPPIFLASVFSLSLFLFLSLCLFTALFAHNNHLITFFSFFSRLLFLFLFFIFKCSNR